MPLTIFSVVLTLEVNAKKKGKKEEGERGERERGRRGCNEKLALNAGQK